MFGNLPLSPLIDLTNALACFLCGLKLAQASRRTPSDKSVRAFRNVYFALVGAYFFFSVPRLLFPQDSTHLGWSFWFAHLFLFTATGFFMQVIASLLVPKLERAIVSGYFVLSGLVLLLGLANFTTPVVNLATNAISWNVRPLFGTASAILILLVLGPAAGYFGWQIFKTKDRSVRLRSWLLTVGILLLVVSTATFYQATTFRATLVSDLFSLFAFLAVFLAVFPRHRANFPVKTDDLPPSSQGPRSSLH